MLHHLRSSLARVAPALAAACLTVAIAACGTDAPTNAPNSISAEIVDPAQTAYLLKRKVPLQQEIKVSTTIRPGQKGGSLKIPEAGFHLSISPEALPPGSAPVTITVTALAGDEVAYQFSPHGLVFAKEKGLAVTQDLSVTMMDGHSGQTLFEAVYFEDELDIDAGAGTVLYKEKFETTQTASGQRLHWRIPHFSGYAISTGRTRTTGY